MARRTVVLMMVLLLAGLVSAEQSGTTTVVLKGGQTLEVREARTMGGMVYVTMPSGEMRAYALSDVDLEASGLAPKKKEEDAGTTPAASSSLVALARKDRGTPRVVITDADVAHVERPAAGAEGDVQQVSGKEASSTLSVSVSGYDRKGQTLTIKGQVANQGKVPISGVRVEAVVKNGSGKTVARAQKVIDGTVDGGRTKAFTMEVQLPEGDIAGVNLRIIGAVAPVEVKRPAKESVPENAETPAE